jgi:hypothetical protein
MMMLGERRDHNHNGPDAAMADNSSETEEQFPF